MGTLGKTLAKLLFVLGNVAVHCYIYQDRSSDIESVLLEPDQPRVISLEPNAKLSIQPSSSAGYNVGFVVVQIHTQIASITVSLSSSFAAATSQNGTGLGVVIPVQQQGTGVAPQSPAAAYVWNLNNQQIKAVVLASVYSTDTPMPGGCNEEFLFEDDANIHLSSLTQGPLASMQFQYADLPVSPSGQPADWCDNTNSWKWLSYDIYVHYLPERSLLETDYLLSVQQFMTVRDVMSNGQLVLTIQRGQNDVKPQLSLMANTGQGFLVNIVVRMANDSRAAATYVPAVTYNCDPAVSSCLGSAYGLVTAIYCILLISGLVLCFVGHKLFKFETFLIGFLVFLWLAYVAVARTTTLPLWGLLVVAAVCGVVGGCGWLAFWVCVGRAHLSMLLTFVAFGYVIAITVFISPFGAMQVLHNDVAYWPIFCGWVFYILLVSAFCTKRWAHFNLVMCAVVGSYCCVSALSSFLGAAIHRWALLPVLRATIPGYSEAILVFPYQLTDALLSAAWVLLAAAGVVVQFSRDKWSPSMPALLAGPASRRLSVRRRTRTGGVNPDLFTDERQRLLDNEGPPQGPPPAYGTVNSNPISYQQQRPLRTGALPGGPRPHSPPPAYGAAA